MNDNLDHTKKTTREATEAILDAYDQKSKCFSFEVPDEAKVSSHIKIVFSIIFVSSRKLLFLMIESL